MYCTYSVGQILELSVSQTEQSGVAVCCCRSELYQIIIGHLYHIRRLLLKLSINIQRDQLDFDTQLTLPLLHLSCFPAFYLLLTSCISCFTLTCVISSLLSFFFYMYKDVLLTVSCQSLARLFLFLLSHSSISKRPLVQCINSFHLVELELSQIPQAQSQLLFYLYCLYFDSCFSKVCQYIYSQRRGSIPCQSNKVCFPQIHSVQAVSQGWRYCTQPAVREKTCSKINMEK